jgi:ribosomal protein S18 acetylase RimI-like enzyme
MRGGARRVGSPAQSRAGPAAPPRLSVRVARPADFVTAGDVTLAAYEASGLLELGEGYADELLDAAGRAGADRTDLLVAVDDTDEVVGSVTFVLPGSPLAELCRPTEAEFRMLAVAPAARRRGVGELLVRACVDRARERGCQGMVISVSTISQPAHRLYPRLGFRRAPERDWRPLPHLPLLAYELAL